MLSTSEVQANASDPILSEALASGNDVLAADRLSQLLTEVANVPIDQLSAWAAITGLRAKLQDASVSQEHPLRSIALSALDLLRGNMADSFDIVIYSSLLDALEQGGLMSVEDRLSLVAMATVPRKITPSEVSMAVRNSDGSSKL